MGTGKRCGAVVSVLLVFAGCGGDDGSDDGNSPADDIGPDDVAAENYDLAYTVCGEFPIEETAAEYGAASQEPVDVATAFAEGYRPAYRQPVFEGCLDALLGNPKRRP